MTRSPQRSDRQSEEAGERNGKRDDDEGAEDWHHATAFLAVAGTGTGHRSGRQTWRPCLVAFSSIKAMAGEMRPAFLALLMATCEQPAFAASLASEPAS